MGSMNSRYLMIASAAVLAALGLLLSFAPEETLAFMGQPTSGAVPVLLQLAGALYLGFALMNWTAKASVLGGIYGKAIVLGNFLHFAMGALALLKAAMDPGFGTINWVLTCIYAVIALLFGRMLFTHPGKQGAGSRAADLNGCVTFDQHAQASYHPAVAAHGRCFGLRRRTVQETTLPCGFRCGGGGHPHH